MNPISVLPLQFSVQQLAVSYQDHRRILLEQLSLLPKGTLLLRSNRHGAILQWQSCGQRMTFSVPEKEISHFQQLLQRRKHFTSQLRFLRVLRPILLRLLRLYPSIDLPELPEISLNDLPFAMPPFSFHRTEPHAQKQPALDFFVPDQVTFLPDLPPSFPEQLLYTTLRGEKVRSAAELIIADSLTAAGLDYLYEPALVFSGKLLRPDFLIPSPSTREPILWEHAGLMHSADYRKSLSWKKEFYASCGFFEGRNLIITYADAKHSLDSRQIQHILSTFFLPR